MTNPDLNMAAAQNLSHSCWEVERMEPKSTRNLMVITVDIETDEIVSVTDENEKPVEKFTSSPASPLNLGGGLVATSASMMLLTRTNPCYKWVTLDGTNWYRKEVACK